MPDSPRRFELVEGAHRKFWEIGSRANVVTVRFGRIGSEGVVKAKTLPTPRRAIAEVDALIREKTAKGYVEKKRTKGSAKESSVLERLSALWAEKRPGFERTLRKGATRAQLAKFAHKLGLPLPKAFEAFYQWHDGAKDEHEVFEGAYGLFQLSSILSHKKMLDEVRGDDDSWDPAWVPFLQENYSDLVCLDTKTGEVFQWFNSRTGRTLLAPNFDAWLAAHAAITESAKSLAEWDEVYDAFNGAKAKKIRARLSPGFPRRRA